MGIKAKNVGVIRNILPPLGAASKDEEEEKNDDDDACVTQTIIFGAGVLYGTRTDAVTGEEQEAYA